jgi:dTDP-4-dehydrorhamnose reductase
MAMNGLKMLITGANGLLGQYLIAALEGSPALVLATGRGAKRFREPVREGFSYRELDITDPAQVEEVVSGFRPDVLIHAAAMTAPDACELDPRQCREVNVVGTSHLVGAAERIGAFFLHLSTDFIFDGEAGPYREEDLPSPLNTYGQSKLEAEEVVRDSHLPWAIVRTVLVYGNTFGATRTHFISWVRDNLVRGERIRVVSDQVRTPTYAGDLARGVLLVAGKKAEGVFHISGRELMTPYDMAMAACGQLGLDHRLMERVNASSFTQPARRPLRTGFVIGKAEKELGFAPLSFEEGLARMLAGDDL